MSEHLKPWLAHLKCGHALATSVAAKPGNWLSCETCHTERLIVSVSRPLAVVPAGVQCELFTADELREAA